MVLPCEGTLQMCENRTSPDLTIRYTDLIFLGVSGEVGFFFSFSLLVIVAMAQGPLNSGSGWNCSCLSRQAYETM